MILRWRDAKPQREAAMRKTIMVLLIVAALVLLLADKAMQQTGPDPQQLRSGTMSILIWQSRRGAL